MEQSFLWFAANLALFCLVWGKTEKSVDKNDYQQNILLQRPIRATQENQLNSAESNKFRSLKKVKRKITRRSKRRRSSLLEEDNKLGRGDPFDATQEKYSDENKTKEQSLNSKNLEGHATSFRTNNEEYFIHGPTQYLPHNHEESSKLNLNLPFNGPRTFDQTYVLPNSNELTHDGESKGQNQIPTLDFHLRSNAYNHFTHKADGSHDVNLNLPISDPLVETQELNPFLDLHRPLIPIHQSFDEQGLQGSGEFIPSSTPQVSQEYFHPFHHNSFEYQLESDPGRTSQFSSEFTTVKSNNLCAALNFKLQKLYKSLYPYLDPRTPHPRPEVLSKLLNIVQLYLNLSRHYDFSRMTEQQVLYILYCYVLGQLQLPTPIDGGNNPEHPIDVWVTNDADLYPNNPDDETPITLAIEITPILQEALIKYLTKIGLLPNIDNRRFPKRCKIKAARRFILRLQSAVGEYKKSFETCSNYFPFLDKTRKLSHQFYFGSDYFDFDDMNYNEQRRVNGSQY